MTTTWCGDAPKECEICSKHIINVFIDGKTQSGTVWRGRWACMCIACHQVYGIGLGTNRGQQYEKQLDGGLGATRWVKVQG